MIPTSLWLKWLAHCRDCLPLPSLPALPKTCSAASTHKCVSRQETFCYPVTNVPHSVQLLKWLVLFELLQAPGCSGVKRRAQTAASCRGTGEGTEMGDQARHLLGKRHLRSQGSFFHSFLPFILTLTSLWKTKVGGGLGSLPACSASSDPAVVPLLPVILSN